MTLLDRNFWHATLKLGRMLSSRWFRPLGVVGSAGTVAMFCAALTFGINARALGPVDLGILALLQAYSSLISGFCTFDNWQVIVRLGSRSPKVLPLTLASGVTLDVLASIAAFAISVFGILILGPVVGLTSDIKPLALLFSLGLIAGVTGTPKGYFRLKGDYNLIALHQVSLAAALLLISTVLYVADAPLIIYCIVFPVASATFNSLMLVWLLFDLRRQKTALENPLRSRRGKRVLRIYFAQAASNGALSSLVNSKSQIPLMMAAGMLGPYGAGIFAAASRGASLISRLTAAVNHVIFPNVVERVARQSGRGWTRQVWIIATVTITVSVMAAVLGYLLRGPIIAILAGGEFDAAATVFVLLLIAECFTFASLQFSATIQSIEGTVRLMFLFAFTTVITLVVGLWLGSVLGVVGVAAGLLVANAFSYIVMLIWCLFYSLQDARRTRNQNGAVQQ